MVILIASGTQTILPQFTLIQIKMMHWYDMGSFVQTKHLCVLIHTWSKGEVGAVKPVHALQENIFSDRSKAVLLLWIIHVISVLCLSCFRARLFIDAFWSPAGKGLTSWLSFLMFNCEFVTFQLVSWVRCCTWFYRFLIFASFWLSSGYALLATVNTLLQW